VTSADKPGLISIAMVTLLQVRSVVTKITRLIGDTNKRYMILYMVIDFVKNTSTVQLYQRCLEKHFIKINKDGKMKKVFFFLS